MNSSFTVRSVIVLLLIFYFYFLSKDTEQENREQTSLATTKLNKSKHASKSSVESQHTAATKQTKISALLLKAAGCLIDPQGTVLNSWNAVWVVLSDDGLEFYKKKTDRSPKGMIPLKGATLISPCQDFTKRMVRKCQLRTSTLGLELWNQSLQQTMWELKCRIKRSDYTGTATSLLFSSKLSSVLMLVFLISEGGGVSKVSKGKV